MKTMNRFGVRLATAASVAIALSSCTKAHLLGANKSRATPLLLTSIVPSSGPIAGGTAVTIRGNGFAPGSVVTIDGAPCNSVQVVSSGQIECVTSAVASPLVGEVSVQTPTASGSGLSYSYLGQIKAIATSISSGGVFSTSGTYRVRATIGAVSGAVPNNMQTGTGIIKLGGIQGIIKAQK